MSKFSLEVEKVKGGHLDDIRTLVGNSITDQQLRQFFLENGGITPKNLRKLLADEIAKTNKSNNLAKIGLIVEKFIPEIEEMNTPQLGARLAKSIDPNSNPTQVAEAIAKYIQSQMKYDAMTAILTMLPRFDFQKQDVITVKNSDKLFGSIGRNSSIQINDNSRQEWISKLQRKHQTINGSEQKGIIQGMINALSKRSGKETEIITNLLMEVKDPFVLMEIGMSLSNIAISIPDNLSINKETGYRNGVCRHYSLIAKKLYEETKKNLPKNTELQNSELLYVLNPGMQHAYNLLVYENTPGRIERKYIDITDFIIKNELYPKDNRGKGEILAQLNEQNFL